MATTSTRPTVLKFGGSSLGAPERLARIIDLTIGEAKKGPLAVVVSAMGDTTDFLIEAAEQAAKGDYEASTRSLKCVEELVSNNVSGALKSFEFIPAANDDDALEEALSSLLLELKQMLYGLHLVRQLTPQSLDLVMSFGERLSATVVAHLLNARGSESIFVDSRTWTLTDDTFGEANVDWDATASRVAKLAGDWRGKITIHTGFLGRTSDQRTTTLGRNGSDYTATLLARALHAEEVVRWTDVSGVMTADPRIVRDAYPLKCLTYMEALELANFGAKVFHPRTMIPLIRSGIPMRIRNTMHPQDPGTVVNRAGNTSGVTPTSVTSLENLAMLEVEWTRVSLTQQAQISDRVLRALDKAHIPVWMATQTAQGQAISAVIPKGLLPLALTAVESELQHELESGEVNAIASDKDVTLLSLVAESMGHTPSVAGRFFHALGRVGVNIRAIAQGASSRSISCVIGAKDTPVAVRTVHAAFNFSEQQVSLCLLGTGTVGTALIEQLCRQTNELRQQHGVRIRVVGILTSTRMLWNDEGIELSRALETLESEGSERISDRELLVRMQRQPVPIMVDCTAAPRMEHLYQACFESGVHVVGANKKPLTVDQKTYESLQDSARRQHRAWLYETTVGAALPIIDTLQNLIRTGDSVQKLEGSFSGTLGYLTNELMAGSPLSKAVRKAGKLGYMEPNPADDLSGLDVARKALILARELGLKVDLSDISIEALVPDEIIAAPDLLSFFEKLEEYEAELEAELATMRKERRMLRYLAQIHIDPKGGATITVGPTSVPHDHPSATLRGAESFIAFTSSRYKEHPLLVRGPGAGAQVTASGVLADLLRLPLMLRGH